MTDTHETIADIIAAKRREANYIVQVSQGKCQTRRDKAEDEARDIRREADRIEAAHKREIEATAAKCCQLGRLAGYGASEIKHQQEPVGDAAKLREALLRCDAIAHFPEVRDYQSIKDMRNIIKHALAAPPRNCDRPECATTKAAQDVWRKEDGGKTAYYEWLLATAMAEEGGAK